jgi:ATP-dependent phosphofructokinase / diphosphate-dependent phosphofructokinase
MKVGVLSGGGDAPGINAVIRAAVRDGIEVYDNEMFGIKEGWSGLLKESYIPLNLNTISGILPRGGSILGTSRTNPFKTQDDPYKVLQNIKKAGIDALIAIGGDDTLTVASEMYKLGLNCVAVPKTIDNDLSGTDYTFGFNTAVAIATEAIDRLHTTAETHNRVMIIEVMGRYTGWIALDAGTAGGADVILIPEKPFRIEEIAKYIKKRKERGKNFSLIVVAEGAKMQGGKEIVCSDTIDEFGHVHLGGIGFFLAKEIQKMLPVETRVVVLGHLQRGGSPTAFDRILATRFGKAAIKAVNRSEFGYMVALKGKDIVSVSLKDVIGKRKVVDPQIYESGSTCFG